MYLCEMRSLRQLCARVSLEDSHQRSVQLLSGCEVSSGRRALKIGTYSKYRVLYVCGMGWRGREGRKEEVFCVYTEAEYICQYSLIS